MRPGGAVGGRRRRRAKRSKHATAVSGRLGDRGHSPWIRPVWTAENDSGPLYRVRWQVEAGDKTLEELAEGWPVTGQTRRGLWPRPLVTLASYCMPCYWNAAAGGLRATSGVIWTNHGQATWWRSWHLMTHWMVHRRSAVSPGGKSRMACLYRVMKERRRQRQLQTLPAAVQHLFTAGGGAVMYHPQARAGRLIHDSTSSLQFNDLALKLARMAFAPFSHS